MELRRQGSLVEPLGSEEPRGRARLHSSEDPPRALKSLARIVDGDLCHRCGSCIGICPTKVLGLDSEDYPVVDNLSACTDCDLCVKVCPGDEFDAVGTAQQLFGHVPDMEDMHGHFEAAYLSHASDKTVRQKSTSGGLVTGLLISLLERGQIDGAVVITSDEKIPWKGKPIIARSREEIFAATKSKYAISPTNAVFEEIRSIPGRYALVGLPCQLHGFHKAARLDKRIRERVVVTIGLFCHAAVEHEPMRIIWENLGDTRNDTVRFISRVGKHPGTPHVEHKDGSLTPVYFPDAKGYRPSSMEIINILYRLYTPARCLTCYDSTAEFADIAVGDPWMAAPTEEINFLDGYSFTLARTEKAKAFLEEAEAAGDLVLKPLEKEVARTSNTMMGEEKRWRAFRIIETRRRQGHPTPLYGFKIPSAKGLQFVLTELNMLSHIFCFLSCGQKTVMKLVFSPLGYGLLWLNHQKRLFRNFRRDFFAKKRREKQANQ